MQQTPDEQRRLLAVARAARVERVRGLMSDSEVARLLADMARTAALFLVIDSSP